MSRSDGGYQAGEWGEESASPQPGQVHTRHQATHQHSHTHIRLTQPGQVHTRHQATIPNIAILIIISASPQPGQVHTRHQATIPNIAISHTHHTVFSITF